MAVELSTGCIGFMSPGRHPPGIGRGAPDSIPGFLLARLAVSQDQQGGGRGGDLLALALDQILGAVAIGGGRLVVVDAIDETVPASAGTVWFKPTPADPGRLIMQTSTAAAALGVAWP